MRKGMETLSFKERKLIDYYELLWYLQHKVPTVTEAAEHLGFKQTEINYFLSRKPVTNALKRRGIPWEQHSEEGLTDKQLAAAITIMNFADERSNTDKLDELGINPSQYYAWLNDPQFNNLVNRLAEQNLGNIRPAAITEYTKLIQKGEWKAIQHYLDTTGVGKADNASHSEQLLKMIVEIIQKHVKDPTTIIAIAQDIKLAAANRTLEVATEETRAITSSVVEESEITEARKKLNI